MPEISQDAFEFAQNAYVEHVKSVLDDPSDMLHPWRQHEPAEEFASLRKLGRDLGFDFDAVCVEHGSGYERQRLIDIEAGKLAPAPREKPPWAR
jgi:hypothetical protein